MARLEIPVERYVDDYGVGVPATLAIIAFACFYFIRPAFDVPSMYGMIGVTMIFLFGVLCIWLSGLFYAHVDVYNWFDRPGVDTTPDPPEPTDNDTINS